MPTEKVSIVSLQRNLESDRLFRMRRHPQWTENYCLYRDTVITNRLTQRQSVNVPYMKETFMTLIATTGTPPDVYFEELGNDKQKELLVNELWKEAFDRLKLTILDRVDKKQEFLYGRTFAKVNIIDGKFVIDIIDPQDVLVDRFVKPWEIRSARHITHVGIYQTLSDLSRNEMYDQEMVNELKAFFETPVGMVKAGENSQIVADRSQRLRDMGVPDVEDPIVGETYVELNESQIKVWDPVANEDVVYVVVNANGSKKIMEKPLRDILGINVFTWATWAGDVEATDFWSDGFGDVVRPLNQIANIRVSQKVENGTLANYGMQFYDAKADKAWSPVGFTPSPFGFYPLPGKPGDILQRVEIPQMPDVFEELNWYKEQIQGATAATATEKGQDSPQDQTATEITLLAQKAAKRITSAAPFYEQYWTDIGDLFQMLLNANPDLLEPVTLYKKNTKGVYYPRQIQPQEVVSKAGYRCKVTSRAKKDADALEGIQKVKIGLADFPGNVALAGILKKKELDFMGLTPDEAREVMDFDLQQQQAALAPPAPSGASPSPDQNSGPDVLDQALQHQNQALAGIPV